MYEIHGLCSVAGSKRGPFTFQPLNSEILRAGLSFDGLT